MTTAAGESLATIDVRGTQLQTFIGGGGRTVFFLQAASWIGDDKAFLRELARHAHVVAPLHPGVGTGADRNNANSVDDLAYLYLDMIEQMGLEDVTLVGASFGGWVAAEMAVRRCNALRRLALIDAFGIKPGKPDERDIVDIFGTKDEELRRLSFADISRAGGDLRSLGDEELRLRLRCRDALARFGWQPYMHNPRLKHRLHRINVPALLLWGEKDGVVKPDYGRAYADLIPGAQFELVPDAGHLAHIEQAQAVAARIAAFATA